MKKLKLFKTLLLIGPLTTSLPIVLSSCKSNTVDAAPDVSGVHWKGRTEGQFNENEYDIDLNAETITYKGSSEFCAHNLVIPDEVTYKGKQLKVLFAKGCFLNNFHLVNTITLNKYMDNIPQRCFENCTSLRKVIFTTYPKVVQKRAFMNCLLVKDFRVLINNREYQNWAIQLQRIEDYAFSKCVIDMQHFILGQDLEYLGRYAFSSCYRIVELNMQLCTKLKAIGNGAFSNCFNITRVYLPNNGQLSEIGDKAFAECSALKMVCLPEGTTLTLSLGNAAFRNCENLEGFEGTCYITKIGKSCFENAISLKFFPWENADDDIEIGASAFYGCSFGKITLTANITDVGNYAFSDSSIIVIDFSKTRYTSNVQKWTGIWIFTLLGKVGTVVLPKDDEQIESLWKNFLKNQGLKLKEPDETDGWNIRYE